MAFQRFYDNWSHQLHRLIELLKKAPKNPSNPEEHTHLCRLIQKLGYHLCDFYRVKSMVARQDVLALLAAPWYTSLQRSLQWMGGWRPTTAFHLIHTESTCDFESRLDDVIKGNIQVGDLGDISPHQFASINELQLQTSKEENAISTQLSNWQLILDDVMHDAVSEVMLKTGDNEEIEKKLELLGSVVQKADDLRMKTIGNVLKLLTPQQAAEFFIAAAQIHFGVHSWGLILDGKNSRR